MANLEKLQSQQELLQEAQNTSRKLWRVVEQSADLVVMTDAQGIIEYVNPAFEVLTGYSREEAIGKTHRILKSGQQRAELYRELWDTILSGGVFRGMLANRKKMGKYSTSKKSLLHYSTCMARLRTLSVLTMTLPRGGSLRSNCSRHKGWTRSDA